MASTSAGVDFSTKCAASRRRTGGAPNPGEEAARHGSKLQHTLNRWIPWPDERGYEIRTREGVNPTRSPNPQTMVQTSPQVCVYVAQRSLKHSGVATNEDCSVVAFLVFIRVDDGL